MCLGLTLYLYELVLQQRWDSSYGEAHEVSDTRGPGRREALSDKHDQAALSSGGWGAGSEGGCAAYTTATARGGGGVFLE